MGSSWSPEEEQQLRDAFAAHKNETENLPFGAKEASFADWRSRVATAHGRTTGGISARLVKLGLIEDTARNRAGVGNRPAGLPPAPVRPTRPFPSGTSAPRPAPPRPAELTEEEKDNLPF